MKDIIKYINNHNLENKMFDEQTYNDLLNLCKLKWGQVPSNYFNKPMIETDIQKEKDLRKACYSICKRKNIPTRDETTASINYLYSIRNSININAKEKQLIIDFYNLNQSFIHTYLKNNNGKQNINKLKEQTKWCYLTIHHDKEISMFALSNWEANTWDNWMKRVHHKENLTKVDWVIHMILHHVINVCNNKTTTAVSDFETYLKDCLYQIKSNHKYDKTKLDYLHQTYNDNDIKILYTFLRRRNKWK